MVLFVALDAQQWPQRALTIGKENAELALASKPRNSTRGYFNNLLARFRLEEMLVRAAFSNWRTSDGRLRRESRNDRKRKRKSCGAFGIVRYGAWRFAPLLVA